MIASRRPVRGHQGVLHRFGGCGLGSLGPVTGRGLASLSYRMAELRGEVQLEFDVRPRYRDRVDGTTLRLTQNFFCAAVNPALQSKHDHQRDHGGDQRKRQNRGKSSLHRYPSRVRTHSGCNGTKQKPPKRGDGINYRLARSLWTHDAFSTVYGLRTWMRR
jgi:hypothetical protein